jgi:NADP-dependent 3-hydroxy acid dehydrogenase YdfG
LEAGAAKVYGARDARTVSSDDPRVVPLALDTSKQEQIAAAAKAVRDVTLLVNNSGIASSANVLTTSQAATDNDFRTNVHGTLAVIGGSCPCSSARAAARPS